MILSCSDTKSILATYPFSCRNECLENYPHTRTSKQHRTWNVYVRSWQSQEGLPHTLQEMKRAGEKITMLTACDYSLAKLVDNAGVDVILVGDSASNVMAGQVTTVPMTLEHMIYHAQCVKRAVDRALIVVDMPFGTYQGNSAIALESAIKIMKEAEGHAVKLIGAEIVESIKRILTAGIPVMGHLASPLNQYTNLAI